MKLVVSLMLLGLLTLVGCDKPAEDAATTEPAVAQEEAAEPAVEEAEPSEEEEAAPAGDTVEVAAAGTKFDPPVETEQLPAGAWYCDMGTAHYAQMDEGEKCPICGMKLTQKAGAPAGHGADGHGHDHEDGDDDHEH